MYGKKYMGVVCIIYFIGFDGKILKIWVGVKVKGYVEEVFVVVKVVF